jgi:hypothetical protein
MWHGECIRWATTNKSVRHRKDQTGHRKNLSSTSTFKLSGSSSSIVAVHPLLRSSMLSSSSFSIAASTSNSNQHTKQSCCVMVDRRASGPLQRKAKRASGSCAPHHARLSTLQLCTDASVIVITNQDSTSSRFATWQQLQLLHPQSPCTCAQTVPPRTHLCS